MVNESGSAERSAIRGRGRRRARPDEPARGLAELGVLRGGRERLRRRGSRRRRASIGASYAAARTWPREDTRVRVVEDRRLDPAAEQLVRLAHEVLVERVLGRDEHGEPVPAPPRAAPLLAQRGDRAREADGDHGVEKPDVDAELERVGRGDAEQVALGEPPLDLAPLLGRVAGAVRRETRVVVEPLGGEAVDQLRRLAALGEGQRPQAALDEARLELRRLGERRARAARAPRRGAAGSRGRRCARRAARRRRRSPSTSLPSSSCASSPGFEIVAVASRNCGSEP